MAILKDSMDNSYAYRTSFQSWTGYRDSTWITVRRGVAVERRYRSSTPGNSYVETGAAVGQAGEGARPRILDSLYSDCRTHLDSAGAQDTFRFELDSNYVVRECGYTPRGCQDDCFRGFHLDSLARGL